MRCTPTLGKGGSVVRRKQGWRAEETLFIREAEELEGQLCERRSLTLIHCPRKTILPVRTEMDRLVTSVYQLPRCTKDEWRNGDWRRQVHTPTDQASPIKAYLKRMAYKSVFKHVDSTRRRVSRRNCRTVTIVRRRVSSCAGQAVSQPTNRSRCNLGAMQFGG